MKKHFKGLILKISEIQIQITLRFGMVNSINSNRHKTRIVYIKYVLIELTKPNLSLKYEMYMA